MSININSISDKQCDKCELGILLGTKRLFCIHIKDGVRFGHVKERSVSLNE